MEKCEWKDAKFEGCEKSEEFLDFKDISKGKLLQLDNWNSVIFKFCPFCGADIRKPEPEKPLIVKNGETWVARWEGVDYLCINPNYDDDRDRAMMKRLKPESWKSFTGPNPDITEVTDELALLRPMVMVRNHINNSQFLIKLIYVKPSGIDDEYKFVTIEGHWGFCRFATPHELQEAEK